MTRFRFGWGRPPGKAVGSLAAEIWAADFELYGADCPLGPGPWADRIGGLVATCIGTGDWYLTARGAAGVTKSNVCYATFGADIAVKTSSYMYLEDRTTAILWEQSATTGPTPYLPIMSVSWPSGSTGSPWVTLPHHDGVGYRPGCFHGAGTISGMGLPKINGDADVLHLNAIRKPLAMAANNREILRHDTETWSSPAASGAGAAYPGGFTAGRIFRRSGIASYSEITDATTRHMAIKSIASAPGLASAAALKQWAIAEGVIWP